MIYTVKAFKAKKLHFFSIEFSYIVLNRFAMLHIFYKQCYDFEWISIFKVA